MKILVINFFYPPVISAHAYRWEQIARHWSAQGHEVEVITGRVHGASADGYENGVHVKRVGLIARAASVKPTTAHRTTGGVLGRFKAYAVNMLRPLYRKFYWPDGYWHWTLTAVWAALKCRRTHFDLIVSYYPCMGAHLAAAALYKWGSSRNVRWVADYGDPFSVSETMPPNNFKIYGRLNKFVEKKIFKTATAVVFTNIDTAEAYKTLFPERRNIVVIPHLVDLSKINEASERALKEIPVESKSPDSVNILYVGGFHKGIREPFVLFDLIRGLNAQGKKKYFLKIFGPENGFDLSPEDCPEIIYGGMIEREKAIEMMVRADILVNVENRNCVMAPSKVVEYIGTGKPIINIEDGGIKINELDSYISSGNAISVSASDIGGQQFCGIVEFILEREGKNASAFGVQRILADRTLEQIASRYLKLRYSGCA